MTEKIDLTDHDLLIRIDENTQSMDKKLSAVCKEGRITHDRSIRNESEIRRVKDKQGVIASIQGTISLALAAVLTWFGMRR